MLVHHVSPLLNYGVKLTFLIFVINEKQMVNRKYLDALSKSIEHVSDL